MKFLFDIYKSDGTIEVKEVKATDRNKAWKKIRAAFTDDTLAIVDKILERKV